MKKEYLPILEQKEDIRHGEYLFPVQKYSSTISPAIPLVAPHWHEEAELAYITDGQCSYHLNLTDHLVEAGDLVFVPPRTLHSVFQLNHHLMQSETYVFHLNFLGGNSADICSIKYLTPLFNQEYTLPPVIKKNHPSYSSLLGIFQQIDSLYGTQPSGYELALKSLFLQLIFLLLPYGEQDASSSLAFHSEHSEKLKTALNYIEAQYAEPLAIKEMAALCYFSEYHFMRFFKKHTGMTCLEYINNLRLEKAVELFEQGSTTIMEVSLSTGFRNLSYFHRAFKKKYGITPGMFLKQLR